MGHSNNHPGFVQIDQKSRSKEYKQLNGQEVQLYLRKISNWPYKSIGYDLVSSKKYETDIPVIAKIKKTAFNGYRVHIQFHPISCNGVIRPFYCLTTLGGRGWWNTTIEEFINKLIVR